MGVTRDGMSRRERVEAAGGSEGAMKRFYAMIGAVLAGCVVTGCSTNPATGKSAFTLLSWDDERSLGAEAAPQFTEEFGGAVSDAGCQGYVDEVGRKLVANIEPGVPALEWEFTLLDSGVINAFALPGGKVFFSRGLAAELTSEAQMAGVLGHEVGHVTARHGNQRLSTATGLSALIKAGQVAAAVAGEGSSWGVLASDVGVPALQVGGQIVLLKYGRGEELEADALGMRYMSRAGYNPIGQREVMAILAREAGTGRQLEFLSTHPHPESRIAQIDELLRTEYAHTQNNASFGTFEDAYASRLLERLRRLPAPRHTGTEQARINLEDPTTWCAHCALAAAGDEDDGAVVAAKR